MIPGMDHCAGGVGPDRHDPVTAVIDWVEKGKAPDSMVASKVVNGQIVRTRPLCPYPQVARYNGTGSIDEAATFRASDRRQIRGGFSLLFLDATRAGQSMTMLAC
jgi:feruloyl esterase